MLLYIIDLLFLCHSESWRIHLLAKVKYISLKHETIYSNFKKKKSFVKTICLRQSKNQTRKLLMDRSQLARLHNYSQKTMT